MSMYVVYDTFPVPPDGGANAPWVRALWGMGDTPEDAKADALAQFKDGNSEVNDIRELVLESSTWDQHVMGSWQLRKVTDRLEKKLKAGWVWDGDDYSEQFSPLFIAPDGCLDIKDEH